MTSCKEWLEAVANGGHDFQGAFPVLEVCYWNARRFFIYLRSIYYYYYYFFLLPAGVTVFTAENLQKNNIRKSFRLDPFVTEKSI